MELKDLTMTQKSAWDVLSADNDKVMAFSEDYKKFLDMGKTERECVNVSIAELEAKGFKHISAYETLKPGDKVYQDIHGKGLVAAVIGSEDMSNGLAILGAHIDSPRVDLKPMPMFEDGDMAFLKTHYYGGIKKYQWATIPLAIHGVIFNKDGEKIEIAIGDKENDPIFVINEILIHLSRQS